MKTWKVIFSFFFSLGLIVFLFVSVSFSGDLLRNKSVFTASLAEIKPKTIEVIEPTPEPEELLMEEEVLPSIVVYSKQDQIDDILEKIDILQRQINELKALEETEKEEILVDKEEQIEKEVVKDEPKIEVIIAQNVNDDIGGSIMFPKIVISEVQIGSETDSKQEFVELFNPNNYEVELSGWYLQRKTKTGSSFSSFASSNLFSGKKISAKGYFLIARDDASFPRHITVTSALTEDNSLVLKDPNGDIMDKLGFGEASEFETMATVNPPAGLSIGRKFVGEDEADTNNNLADFEVTVPTPTAQNAIYIEEPAPEPTPEPAEPVVETPLENILISQVQTQGVTVKDEFVELQNPNDVEVDLTGFVLKKKTASGTESNLVSAGSFVGMIPIRGYFLIAPQDNEDGTKNYTGLVEPNLRYSGQSFSVASGNTILLYDASEILMDEYITSDGSESEEEEPEEVPPLDPPPSDPPSDPPVDPPTPPEAKVIINEIAWMGTTESANNEWMELLNVGEGIVDLSGWTLASADGTPLISLSGSIDVGGFYLLERTNDDSVPDAIADNIYTGSLGNSGEYLQLKDATGNIKDEIDCTGGWCAGDNETKQTMQRKDPLSSGNDVTNWQTSEDVGGSPKF